MKVFVGVSGGVDSSVSAYLLQKQGHDVCGVFIEIALSLPTDTCTSYEDKQHAMRACAHLGIPFKVVSATRKYCDSVLNSFIEEYRLGKTPNPDILCNMHVKFNVLANYAKENGGFLATGHYAFVKRDGEVSRLFQSKDTEKDQTYFIYPIKQEILQNTLFPIGGYLKTEVRAIARKAKLPAADKKDSTGLCFIGNISMSDFLEAYIPVKEGDICDVKTQEVIGKHKGISFYTEGQRHKLGTSTPGPFFVIQKDVDKNVLWVSKDIPNKFGSKVYKIGAVHKITNTKPTLGRFRHTGSLTDLHISKDTAVFKDSVFIAPGQSLALYASDGECVGGCEILAKI